MSQKASNALKAALSSSLALLLTALCPGVNAYAAASRAIMQHGKTPMSQAAFRLAAPIGQAALTPLQNTAGLKLTGSTSLSHAPSLVAPKANAAAASAVNPKIDATLPAADKGQTPQAEPAASPAAAPAGIGQVEKIAEEVTQAIESAGPVSKASEEKAVGLSSELDKAIKIGRDAAAKPEQAPVPADPILKESLGTSKPISLKEPAAPAQDPATDVPAANPEPSTRDQQAEQPQESHDLTWKGLAMGLAGAVVSVIGKTIPLSFIVYRYMPRIIADSYKALYKTGQIGRNYKTLIGILIVPTSILVAALVPVAVAAYSLFAGFKQTVDSGIKNVFKDVVSDIKNASQLIPKYLAKAEDYIRNDKGEGPRTDISFKALARGVSGGIIGLILIGLGATGITYARLPEMIFTFYAKLFKTQDIGKVTKTGYILLSLVAIPLSLVLVPLGAVLSGLFIGAKTGNKDGMKAVVIKAKEELLTFNKYLSKELDELWGDGAAHLAGEPKDIAKMMRHKALASAVAGALLGLPAGAFLGTMGGAIGALIGAGVAVSGAILGIALGGYLGMRVGYKIGFGKDILGLFITIGAAALGAALGAEGGFWGGMILGALAGSAGGVWGSLAGAVAFAPIGALLLAALAVGFEFLMHPDYYKALKAAQKKSDAPSSMLFSENAAAPAPEDIPMRMDPNKIAPALARVLRLHQKYNVMISFRSGLSPADKEDFMFHLSLLTHGAVADDEAAQIVSVQDISGGNVAALSMLASVAFIAELGPANNAHSIAGWLDGNSHNHAAMDPKGSGFKYVLYATLVKDKETLYLQAFAPRKLDYLADFRTTPKFAQEDLSSLRSDQGLPYTVAFETYSPEAAPKTNMLVVEFDSAGMFRFAIVPNFPTTEIKNGKFKPYVPSDADNGAWSPWIEVQ
ncbi:MAG TPA: hypothetical protein DEB40_14685 [Elusimicrobia bacterium]|nr:hypothetical protein [Elusimicrobiota bacterium]HBT62981.1 hypothetical protein [Elusimicrobiota bacterium]